MSRSLMLIVLTIVVLFMTSIYKILVPEADKLPVVAIANYGSHSSLDEIVRGVIDGLHAKGFREGRTIEFKIENVNFDTSLVERMINKLVETKPKVIVAISTPVAQVAKKYVKKIPIVYAGVTDPIEAGLLKQYDKSEENITGSSDKQDLALTLKFAQKLFPQIQRVGLLYSLQETNDIALVKFMQKATAEAKMELVAVPIESMHEIMDKMSKLSGNVDMIYVGASGTIQSSLDAIVYIADQMKIPVFNVSEDAVKKGTVLGSYGVSYYKVGVNAGELISQILKGKKVRDVDPVYPKYEDYYGFISEKKLHDMNYTLPQFLPKSTYIVK